MKRLALPFLVVSVFLAVGCPRPKPLTKATPTPRPLPMRVPPGCEAPQQGLFRHALNPSFRYLASDDGGTLLLTVERPQTDGGFSYEDGGTRVELVRTPNGFVGQTRALVFTPKGTRCTAEFPSEVVSCTDAGIVVRAAVTAAVDDACNVPKRSSPAPRVEHVLLRELATPAQDGGAFDSGVAATAAGSERDAGMADAGR